MIRLIFIVLFLIIFFIFSIPAWLILWIVGKFNRPLKDIVSLRIVQGAFYVVLFLAGTKTTVIGLENIPKDEPVLFVGNHNSIFDILVAYSRMPRLTGFVAKKEIEKVPGLNIWMRMLYCLFLDRDNIKEGLKTILTGIEYIKNGISIHIYPEGTRSKDGKMQPFKEGSLKFAEKSRCKIIPVAQNNTRAIFEAQFPRIKHAHTIIEFGKPIDLNELSKEEVKFLGSYTQNIIQNMYDKNEQLLSERR